MERLKSERRWCVWRYESKDGRRTKVPYVAAGTRGMVNKPETWLSYAQAEALCHTADGIGGLALFLSRREGDEGIALCGIDVDAHRRETNAAADEILSLFSGTYAERSPSGKGIHILCNVQLDRILDEDGLFPYRMKNGEDELEIYVGGKTNRYLTFTGERVSQGEEITDQTEQVLQFLERHMQLQERNQTEDRPKQRPVATGDVDIEDRLARARRSRNGAYFRKLYDEGDLQLYHGDHSAADMALCRQLAFWLSGDEEKIDRAFRASALMRPKWNEARREITYGELTINNAVDGCESFYTPPEKRGDRAPWVAEINQTQPVGEDHPDPTIFGTPITPEGVLGLINEIQEDTETQGNVSVLPLMPGSGKSTAIRLKIRQVIEANDGSGLIVITDSIVRMKDYLETDDEDLRAFFEDFGDRICLMTHDNIQRAREEEPDCPVLIMTTQRWVRLDRDGVRRYLRWNGGVRDLVIVDEQPIFKQQININISDLREIGAAIEQTLPRTAEAARDREDLTSFFGDIVSGHLSRALNAFLDEPLRNDQYYFLYRPNWDAPALFAERKEQVRRYRKQISEYTHGGNFVDVLTRIRAVFQILEQGALVGVRIQGQGIRSSVFSLLLDNYENYHRIGAKVIVLDGTAMLSTCYQLYPDLDMRDCSQYDRDLSRLHIQIVDMPTTKSNLERNENLREKVVEDSKAYLREHFDRFLPHRRVRNTADENQPAGLPEDEQLAIFSYKFMQGAFTDFCGEHRFDWFGKIRGSNDYRKCKVIAQVGVNRFPDGSYFLYELERDPELRAQLLGPETSREEQTEIVKARIRDRNGFTRKAMNQELLAELEQNIFRGTIRNSRDTDDYTFVLFVNGGRRDDLIPWISDRYRRLHADVPPIIGNPQENPLAFMMQRVDPNGPTLAQRCVRWHDLELSMGAEYTYESMAEGANGTVERLRDIRRKGENPAFIAALDAEKQHRGRGVVFVKSSNWYYPEEEDE